MRVDSTPSTMGEVADVAVSGAPEGTTIVAEEQTAGRGRVGRTWESAPSAGLWLSIVLRPPFDPAALGWLPLVAGSAVGRALRAETSLDLRLKWPNDVVVEASDGLAKLGGILAERLPDGAVILGIGINVDHGADELPATGTSLRLLGSTVPRERLLVALLGEFASLYRAWLAGNDPSVDYLPLCITLGSLVRVERAAGLLEGIASGLGPHGELIIIDADGVAHLVSAGDVLLVRPAAG